MKKSLKSDAVRILSSVVDNIGANDTQRLRILTFHSVQDHHQNEWHTSLFNFKMQMQYLFDSGYRTYTIKQIVEQRDFLLNCKEKAVVLTFDDGLLNNYTYVCDILSSFNMNATFFISTENISDQRIPPISKGLMYYHDCLMLSWSDVREIHKSGFEVGSHSHSHDLLAQMPQSLARENVAISKRLLDAELNAPITSFAYPYGHKSAYSGWTKNVLRELGFKAGCTQMGGAVSSSDDLLELPRIGIRGSDSLEVFRQKVTGCYDFLRLVHKYFY